ncbi:MAG: cell division protein FtsA [candidate division Zixibacteria bacterium]|nr:cell division protein FtsA [candidate division Zixibacteria bacterium]
MRFDNIIAGLDIGSSKVRVVVAEAGEDLKIIGIGSAPSDGIRRGVVVNLEKTVESISTALREAELMAGVDINAVYTSIGGDHIRGINSRGVIAVSRSSGEITRADISRAVDAARAVAIPLDREIIHTLPQEFTVDDQPGIKDPTGMSGIRLEVEVHIVTAAATSAQNIYRSIKKAGLDTADLVLTPLASAEAVLTEDEKELGVLLIDFGGGTTDLAIYYDGSIRHTAVIGLGGKSVTSDIAIGLRTPLENAETIKRQYGCALSTLVDAEEKVIVPGVGSRPPKEVSRAVLTAIIEPRVEEIFSLALRELRKTQFSETLATGVVITGGGALMHGVIELCEQVFDMPVKIGAPLGFSGLSDIADDPANATGLGLITYGMKEDFCSMAGVEDSIISRMFGSVTKIFKKEY